MTVATSTSRSGPYAGAGQTGPFVVGFKFIEDSHLVVAKQNASSLVETTLVLNVDYTVTGAGSDAGGTLTLISALAVGYTLTISRDVPLTQLTDYVEGDPFSADSHEEALDKLTMIAQQQAQSLAGAIRVPETSTDLNVLPSADARKNTILAFDATGQPSVTSPVSGSAADVLLQLADSTNVSRGDAQSAVKRTSTAAVATTQHVVNEERHIFPVADYAAAGDGTTDDTDELNAALSSGVLVVDGRGRTFKTSAAVTVPAGVRFQNFTIQMADSNYNALVLSDRSEVFGRVIGTSRVNQYPSAQVGVYAQGKTRIVGVIRVSNTNTGINLESCTDCDIVAHCDSMSGQSGVSEGYGVLLNLSSNFNRIAVFAKQVARHALYISSGSSRNDCICFSEGTVTNFSVQINSRRDQGICTGNVITGKDYGSAGGVVLAMDSTGAADAGGALQNNTVRDFEVVGLAAATGIYVANLYSAYLLTISTIGANLPAGNKFINCSARGTFNSTSLGVVHVGGAAEDTTLRDINIRAVCLNTGGSLVIDSPTGMTTLKGIDIDLLTSGGGVLGAYFNVSSPNYFRFDDVQIICPSATKVFYSGASAAQRIGDGNSFVSNVAVTAISATSSKTATVNVPVHLQGSYTVQALITSESITANPNSDVKVTSKGSTSFVLSVYNGHSAQQDITIDYRIVGLPA